jgi:hypothetical protein
MTADGGRKRVHRSALSRALPAKARLATLEDVDGRTRAAKAALELRTGLINDLGGDPSCAQAELAQRAAVLGTIAAHQEALWLSGKEIDVAAYATITNNQRRTLEVLGIERRPRDVTPSIEQYLSGLGTESSQMGQDAKIKAAQPEETKP